MRPGAIVGPLILIVLGVLFLIDNMGVNIPFGSLLRNGWPFMLILIGVLQMAGALTGRGSVAAGIVVTAIGVLFAFQTLFGVGFRYTWPVILIVIGGIGVLRASGRKGWAR
jgi:hypothetical protein